MKRNIYLTQVDVMRETPLFCSAYLPYSAGVLWVYAKQDEQVAQCYDLKELFFLRTPVDETAARMESPFIAGFSCYCWNTEYNKALAQAIKKVHPNCLILFGGHDILPGGAMLEEFSYIDYLLHGEGELGFRALLAELAKEAPDFTAVPGLSYRADSGTKTNPERVPDTIEHAPSPYLEGVFDAMVAAHPEIQWSTVWETNRGCPHHCVYCDWGQHKAKIRSVSMERLMAELEWMSKNKVEFIWCADANFGILPRDEEILDAMVEAKERTGYPMVFLCQTTKKINERLFRIVQKLNDSGLEKIGPNLAVQSLSPKVLDIIGRANLTEEEFAYWIRRYRQAGFRTHTDLIIGLPGETLESFCAGVEKLFSLGQHEGIQYFPCNLLPNSAMATPAIREKYKIRSRRICFRQTMESMLDKERINEYIDMVIETADMPHSDWLTANHFMLLTHGVHSYGVLRLVAMLLHTEKISSYADFYRKLLTFCEENPDTLIGETMARVEKNFREVSLGEEAEPLQIPGFSFGRMADDQYFICRAVLDPDNFYIDAQRFLQQFEIDPDLLRQLLQYQRESILLPGEEPKIREFDYDFPAYFGAIYDGEPVPLQKKQVKLRFITDFDISNNERYYDAVVRRGRFSSNAFYQTEYIAQGE